MDQWLQASVCACCDGLKFYNGANQLAIRTRLATLAPAEIRLKSILQIFVLNFSFACPPSF